MSWAKPRPRIRESTAVYYKMFIGTHIRPKLGDIKLNQLQTMDIQRLYNELRENGRIRKGELVPLLWSDVDTNNMTISISKQAYRTKGALTVQPPKTITPCEKSPCPQKRWNF